jgi:hypothetical protein
MPWLRRLIMYFGFWFWLTGSGLWGGRLPILIISFILLFCSGGTTGGGRFSVAAAFMSGFSPGFTCYGGAAYFGAVFLRILLLVFASEYTFDFSSQSKYQLK